MKIYTFWTQALSYLSLIVLFAASLPTEDVSFILPTGSYKYISGPKTWGEASSACVAIGGSLVTIDSRQEHYELVGYISEHFDCKFISYLSFI